jgi:hypothetical protein
MRVETLRACYAGGWLEVLDDLAPGHPVVVAALAVAASLLGVMAAVTIVRATLRPLKGGGC